jgi:hypothetical protein
MSILTRILEINKAIKIAQQELKDLPTVNMFCDEDDYQENLEISWRKQELRDTIGEQKDNAQSILNHLGYPGSLEDYINAHKSVVEDVQ